MSTDDAVPHLIPLGEAKARSVFLDVCTIGPGDSFTAYGYKSAVLVGCVSKDGKYVGVGDGNVTDVIFLIQFLLVRKNLGRVAEIAAPLGVFNSVSKISGHTVTLVLRPWVWLWHEKGSGRCEALLEPDVSDFCDISEIDPVKWRFEIEEVLRNAFPSASVWPCDSSALLWFGAFDRTNRLIAVACVDSPWIGECPRVASLAVLPDSRGKRVGSALLVRAAKTAEMLPRISGRQVVEVSAYAEETRVLALYDRLGFQRDALIETIRISSNEPFSPGRPSDWSGSDWSGSA